MNVPMEFHVRHTAMLAASAFRSYQPPSISAPPGLDPPPSFVLRLDSYLDQLKKPTSAKCGRGGDHSESDTAVGSSTSENDTDENDTSENDNIRLQCPLGDAPRTKLRPDANFFVPRPVVDAKLQIALGLDDEPCCARHVPLGLELCQSTHKNFDLSRPEPPRLRTRLRNRRSKTKDEPRTERTATPCGKDQDKSASGTSVGSTASDNNDTNEDSLESADIGLQSNVGTEAKQVQRTKLRAGAKRFVPMPMASMGWQTW